MDQGVGWLVGKAAIVTGSSRGLGRATALGLAREGADVVVNYRVQKAAADEAVAEIRQLGREALAVQADVQERGDCDRLINECVQAFGRLDILVNNAASLESSSFVEMPLEIWDRNLRVNVDGVFHCSQLAAREMIRLGNGGRIIVITSSAASLIWPELVHHCMAKAAADMLARGMACELAPYGITVNMVAPGPAGPTDLNRDLYSDPEQLRATERGIPMGRLASPEDVATAVVLLTAPSADYITGTRMNVDGGFTLTKSS